LKLLAETGGQFEISKALDQVRAAERVLDPQPVVTRQPVRIASRSRNVIRVLMPASLRRNLGR